MVANKCTCVFLLYCSKTYNWYYLNDQVIYYISSAQKNRDVAYRNLNSWSGFANQLKIDHDHILKGNIRKHLCLAWYIPMPPNCDSNFCIVGKRYKIKMM